jgi:hypothetical protein
VAGEALISEVTSELWASYAAGQGFEGDMARLTQVCGESVTRHCGIEHYRKRVSATSLRPTVVSDCHRSSVTQIVEHSYVQPCSRPCSLPCLHQRIASHVECALCQSRSHAQSPSLLCTTCILHLQFAAALATTLEVCREAGAAAAAAAAAAAGGAPGSLSLPGSPTLSSLSLTQSPPEALSLELLRKESLAGLPFAAAAKVRGAVRRQHVCQGLASLSFQARLQALQVPFSLRAEASCSLVTGG